MRWSKVFLAAFVIPWLSAFHLNVKYILNSKGTLLTTHHIYRLHFTNTFWYYFNHSCKMCVCIFKYFFCIKPREFTNCNNKNSKCLYLFFLFIVSGTIFNPCMSQLNCSCFPDLCKQRLAMSMKIISLSYLPPHNLSLVSDVSDISLSSSKPLTISYIS